MSNPDKIAAAAAEATATGAATQQPEATVVAQDTVQEQPPVVEPTEETPAPVAAAPEAPAVKSKETAPTTSAESTESVSRANGSNTANMLQEQWLAYAIAADKTRVQSASSLNALQRTLMNLVENTANLKDVNDFIQVSNYLIRLIQENKTGAFNTSHLFRLFDKNLASPVKTNEIRFAIDAYLCFADVQQRAVNVKQYNLENSAKLCKTPQLRERFVSYFKRISGTR